MTQQTQFNIGTPARCRDGDCGRVIRVVIEPISRTVTHLVVEPAHRVGAGKLVPLELVDSVDSVVHLRCTLAEFDTLEEAEEEHFLATPEEYAGYAQEDVFVWPHWGTGMGMAAGNLGASSGLTMTPHPLIDDVFPAGDVEVRRGQRVQATDGEIGRVEGLVIDRGTNKVTHILLQEGHLWGRRQVAIPMSAVTGVSDAVQLNLTTAQVEHLPVLDLDHPIQGGSREVG